MDERDTRIEALERQMSYVSTTANEQFTLLKKRIEQLEAALASTPKASTDSPVHLENVWVTRARKIEAKKGEVTSPKTSQIQVDMTNDILAEQAERNKTPSSPTATSSSPPQYIATQVLSTSTVTKQHQQQFSSPHPLVNNCSPTRTSSPVAFSIPSPPPVASFSLLRSSLGRLKFLARPPTLVRLSPLACPLFLARPPILLRLSSLARPSHQPPPNSITTSTPQQHSQ